MSEVKQNSLAKKTMIYAVGLFGSKILSFILVPLFSFYITKGELGYYDLLLTTLSLLFPLVTLQTAQATYRYLIDRENQVKTQREIITNAFIILFCSLFLFVGIYFIVYIFSNFDYGFYFGILLVVNSLFLFSQELLRGLNLTREYVKVGIINSFLLLFLSGVALVLFKMKLEGILLANILSNLGAFVYVVYRVKLFNYLDINLKSIIQIKRLLKYSLPLIPNSVSWWAIGVSNKFLILEFLSVDMNGLYAISSRYPGIMIIINSIFMLAWQDQVLSYSSNLKKESTSFSYVLNKFMIFQLSLALFFISISKFLVIYTVDQDFFESYKYMAYLFYSSVFTSLSTFLGAIYLKLENTLKVFITTMIGAVCNILITYIFIDKLSLYAPALGTLFGFIIVFVIRFFDIKKTFAIKMNIVPFLTLNSLIIVFLFFINEDSIKINTLLIFISVFLLIFFNKKLISRIFANIIPKK